MEQRATEAFHAKLKLRNADGTTDSVTPFPDASVLIDKGEGIRFRPIVGTEQSIAQLNIKRYH